MTDLQCTVFIALFVCLGLLLYLVCEYMRFPPAFLAKRFAYFRWRRLLVWSRVYKELWGESPPCPEYFVDFLSDVGERWLAPVTWPESPRDWRHDCQTESESPLEP